MNDNPLARAAARLSLALALALLLGCETQMRQSDRGPWIPVGPGGTLVLSQPVKVPQDRARVFFRNGRLQSTGANQGPSCGIEIRTIPRDGPPEVARGTGDDDDLGAVVGGLHRLFPP